MSFTDKVVNIDRLVRTLSCALIVISVITIWLTTPTENRFARQADEGYYFAYARTIKGGGVSQFPVLLKRHFEDKVAQLYPYPTRIGHVLLTALWLRIFPETFTSLAFLSFICFVIFLIISFFYCRKYFDVNFAWLYCVLLSVYPLSMALAHRVLQESVLNLFWALSFWLFIDFIFEKRRSKFILFLLLFSISLTIKETSVILFPFFIACFIAEKWVYKEQFHVSYLVGIVIWPLLSAGTLYIYMLGGWQNVLLLCRFIIGVHFSQTVTNPYSLFCMGPWYKNIIDYFMLSPWTVLLAIGFLFNIIIRRMTDKKIIYPAVLLIIIYLIQNSMKYNKIIRYILSLDIVVSLFALLALMEVFQQNNNNRKLILVFLAVTGIYLSNYLNYLNLFVRLAIYDPISYWLLGAQQIISTRMF